MQSEKRCVLFVSDSDDLHLLFGEKVRHQVNIAVRYYELGEDENDLTELHEEKNISCIVILTEEEPDVRHVEKIYTYWSSLFADTPIMWCHGHHNNDWFGRPRKNVVWFDASQPQPLESFIQTLKTIVETD